MRRMTSLIARWLHLAPAGVRRLYLRLGLPSITLPTALLLTGLLALAASRWFETFSVVDALVVLVLALVVLSAWSERSRTRILPFRNITSGTDKEAYDAVSHAIADLLEWEIRRINDLESGKVGERVALAVPAVARGQDPRTSTFKGLATAGEDGGDALAEVGTVSVGPLSVPVGAFLSLVLPARRVISGTIRHLDGTVTIVAEYTGKPRQKWLIAGTIDSESAEADLRKIIRRLAYEMVLSLRAGDVNVASYRHHLEGLERYDGFIRTENIGELDEAERRFSQAVTINPTFASAYYNLGVTYEMRHRITQALEEEPVGGHFLERAEAMYRRVVELEPSRSDARLQLARVALVQGRLEEAADGCREAVEAADSSGQLNPSARFWLAESLAAKARTDPDAVAGYKAAVVEYRRAWREFLMLRRERRLSARLTSEIEGINDELAEVALGLAWTERDLSRVASSPRAVTRHLRRAERALRLATRVKPGRSDVHTQLGRFLADADIRSALSMRGSSIRVISQRFRRGHKTDEWQELIEAFRLDSGNHDAVWALSRLLADAGAYDAAADALRIALAINPNYAASWAELAEYTASRGAVDDALSLAGVALALDPWSGRIYEELGRLYADKGARDEAGSSHNYTAAEVYTHLADTLPEHADPAAWLEQQLAAADTPTDGVARTRRRVQEWVLGWLYASRRERHADALRWLDEAESIDSSDAPETLLTHHERARLYQGLGEHTRAVREFATAVRSDLPLLGDAPVEWWLDLADAYAEAPSEFADRAVAAYTTAADCDTPTLELASENRRATVRGDSPGVRSRARALAGRAGVHADSGRRLEALRDCIDAIRIEPAYAYPRLTLAELSKVSGDYEQALHEWAIIRPLVPHLPWIVAQATGGIWHERARLTTDAPRRTAFLERALDAYRTAICEWLDPETEAGIRSSMADVLDDLGRVAEAIRERENALMIGKELPTSDDYRLYLAVAYDNAKRFADAEREYLNCLEVRLRTYEVAGEGDERAEAGQNLAVVENYLAYLYADQGIELEEGRRLVEEAIARVGAEDEPVLHGAFLDTRGWLRYQQGDFDGAIEDLRLAIRAERGQEATLDRQHLALAYEARAAMRTQRDERVRELDLARREWQRIVDHDPESSSAKAARVRLNASDVRSLLTPESSEARAPSADAGAHE